MPDLSKLAEPFEDADVEWRVSRAGVGGKTGVWCSVVAYITARAIQKRLDDVCGIENWRNEEPRIIEMNGKSYFAVGISIRLDKEWVTKWDVCEPTRAGDIDPAKGGFSGGMKRAGAQWGIGRYLYYLEEVYADTTQDSQKGSRIWNWARLPKDKGGLEYYWKTPSLPAWALPKGESEGPKGITVAQLEALKKAWRLKFAPTEKNRKELAEGFSRFVVSVVGDFPLADASTWTADALERCTKRIQETKEPNGVSSDVPFE